ncbi:MAG TPA: efflux RND transporter permease subunit [Nevskiaceae bacterium]|nr:efflux RND transporter permease subunit [Nevskiaceae bacterium]
MQISANRLVSAIEPALYGNRGRIVTLSILIVLTVALFAQALRIKPDAGFEKSIPLGHPYMAVFKQYQQQFGGANSLLIAVMLKPDAPEPDIYNAAFLATLHDATDEIFYAKAIDRSQVSSIFTRNVRYMEVVDGGFIAGDVIRAEYEPTPETFAQVRENVGKAGIIGRYVTADQRGAMIYAEVLERNPVTSEKTDFVAVAHDLERIRRKFTDPRSPQYNPYVDVHIIGFTKVIGDVSDAVGEVALFFALTVVGTMFALWWYLGSFRLALLPLGCSLVAVVWEFGLLKTLGYGLDPFAIMVPFLVLAVSTSHGVQYVNTWADEVVGGRNSFEASRLTFHRLFVPGTIALLTNVAGFATIALVPIGIIREMSVNACLGMVAVIATNKLLMPIWLSYLGVKDVDAFRAKRLAKLHAGDKLWRALSAVTEKPIAALLIAASLVVLGVSWRIQDHRIIGDAQLGVPELTPDSVYNRDVAAITSSFTIGTDLLKVIAETDAEACIEYPVLEQIDRFGWRMQNVPGVRSTKAFTSFARQMYSAQLELDPRFNALPRNRSVLALINQAISTGSGLLDYHCASMPVLIFIGDHRAETIASLVSAVKQFERDNNAEFFAEHPDVTPEYCDRKTAVRRQMGADSDEYVALDKHCPVHFAIGSGNVAVMAATNEVVKDKELATILWVYAVIVVLVLISYRSASGLLAICIPLFMVSIFANALMALFGIGLKVATLPVITLAVGIGVDYGIYIYDLIRHHVKVEGLPLREAYFRTLQKTGKAVVFTGLCLAGGVATWLFSDLQFQRDMGRLLVFMFTANMLGAVLLCPAYCRFLMRTSVR